MNSKNILKVALDITSYPPFAYAIVYLLNVIVFSLLYVYFFQDDFEDYSINFVQSIYFSVVTVTTLGYGDLTPKFDATSLLLTITAQVVMGVITIGLFLNAISHQLSDRKDSARKEYEKEVEERNLAKLLTILKPAFTNYLEILAETYKVTTTSEAGFVKALPSELFNQDYYDQISRQDFLSDETRYGKGVMKWGQFIDQENNKFKAAIDDFLNKFATSLPIVLVESLVALKSHQFLYHCRQAIQLSQMNFQQDFNISKMNMLTIEHSSVGIPEKPSSIRDFHELFLNVLLLIEDKTEGGPIVMTVDLREGVSAPPIGSAIVDIIKFGPFEESNN